MSGVEKNVKPWWVYRGEKTLASIAEKKPKWRDKNNKTHNAKAFKTFNSEIIDAVNAAIYLRRPLLVTGDPGIGKSSLAKSIAEELTGKEVLHWQVTSKSVLKEALYSYDALARLHDMQMKKLYIEQEQKGQKLEEFSNTSIAIENYLKLGALGEAFLSESPRVVLIDEIDKSDIDLPNDLLHIFEEQEFEIEELKRIKKEEIEIGGYTITNGKVEVQGDFPIIVMTSNGEQEFPPAFLRRCISVNLALPEDKEEQIKILEEMVKGHFEEKELNDEDNKKRVEALIEKFVDLKQHEGRLLSNDQLLNAVFLIVSDKKMNYEMFKETVLQSLE